MNGGRASSVFIRFFSASFAACSSAIVRVSPGAEIQWHLFEYSNMYIKKEHWVIFDSVDAYQC